MFHSLGGGQQPGPAVHGPFIPVHPSGAAERGPLGPGGPRLGPPSWEARALENVSKAGGEIGGNRSKLHLFPLLTPLIQESTGTVTEILV